MHTEIQTQRTPSNWRYNLLLLSVISGWVLVTSRIPTDKLFSLAANYQFLTRFSSFHKATHTLKGRPPKLVKAARSSWLRTGVNGWSISILWRLKPLWSQANLLSCEMNPPESKAKSTRKQGQERKHSQDMEIWDKNHHVTLRPHFHLNKQVVFCCCCFFLRQIFIQVRQTCLN